MNLVSSASILKKYDIRITPPDLDIELVRSPQLKTIANHGAEAGEFADEVDNSLSNRLHLTERKR